MNTLDEYQAKLDALPGREVKIHSKWGELKFGKTEGTLSDSFVHVRFPNPLILGYPFMGMTCASADFSIRTGQRHIWGQGESFDVDDWTLDLKSMTQ